MITCLKLLRVYEKKPDEIFLRIIRHTIRTAIRLRGKEINLKSGEKPGKMVHEYREKGYDYLTKKPINWYVYPNKTIRNYDSVDATPLFLILAAEYYNATNDKNLFEDILPAAEKAFEYLTKFSPKSGNKLFLEYQLQRPEDHGGLVNQGWMDSIDSILIYGEPPKEPIALVEVQSYYWKALRLWSRIYENIDKTRAETLKSRADQLKKEFNNKFLMRSKDLYYFVYAIFGQIAHILSVRSNPGHCMWASIIENGKPESIIEDQYMPDVVHRLLNPDLFVEGAGIRTLSTESKFFDPCSYHNGSVWPFDNGLIAEGFENFGYKKEAQQIKSSVINAVSQFGTMLELYCAFDGKIKEYVEHGGHYGAHEQAWTAATILDFTT